MKTKQVIVAGMPPSAPEGSHHKAIDYYDLINRWLERGDQSIQGAEKKSDYYEGRSDGIFQSLSDAARELWGICGDGRSWEEYLAEYYTRKEVEADKL